MYNGRHAYLTKENNFVYNKVLWNYYKLRQVSLLQSAMDSYYKWGQLFLLQSATRFITSCDRYYMPDGFISGAPRAREARARGRSPIAK